MYTDGLKGATMTLNEYFSEEPRGAKSEMAAYLGISLTWLSLVINGKRKVSPKLALAIEEATQGLVKKADLRPDLFL